MPEKLKTQLKVNDSLIELNEFAHEFITRIVICAVSMLKGGTGVKSLVFNLEGEEVDLTINDKAIPLSAFPKDALVCTFTGMVSSLRGVDQINKLYIDIKEV